MSDLEQRIRQSLEPILELPDPRQRISAYHDMPYALFRYDPDAEFELRSQVTLLATRLSQKGKRVKRKAEEAAGYVDRHGGPEQFIRLTTRIEKSVGSLVGAEALALEMAVDEQAELRELERQWQQAEEIANIADGLLIDPAVDEALRKLRKPDQPDG